MATADLVGVSHRAQPRDLGDRLLEARRALHHLGHLEVNLHHRHRSMAQADNSENTRLMQCACDGSRVARQRLETERRCYSSWSHASQYPGFAAHQAAYSGSGPPGALVAALWGSAGRHRAGPRSWLLPVIRGPARTRTPADPFSFACSSAACARSECSLAL